MTDALWKRALRRLWAAQARLGGTDLGGTDLGGTDRGAAAGLLAERRGRPVIPAAVTSHLAGRSAGDVARALDPTAQPDGLLRQQTPTTCGSASLAVARMLADPAQALRVLDGYDVATGREVGGDVRSRFRVEEQAVMARTNAFRGYPGRPSLPWPRALGTPPWGARREMDRTAGAGGPRHRVLCIDSDSPARRAAAYDLLDATARTGRTVPLYVGDGAVPRHVVLVIGASDDALTVWDPAVGGTRRLGRSAFVHGPMSVAGWDRPWAAVVGD